ncbi:MAG: rhomboid family intramembrane serine protease [Bacteroidetes bacterium]|nr:rhomboid family intramembrane serine protease [Bacteroidota bacterium]
MNSYRSYNPYAMTPVVKWLFIVNISVFALSCLLYFQFNFDLNTVLGLYNYESENFRPWQFITYAFAHAYVGQYGNVSFMHLLANMFALYMFGGMVEQRLGSKKFFIYYMICALGAVLLYWGYTNYQAYAYQIEISELIRDITPFDFYNYILKYKHMLNENALPQIERFYTEWKENPDSAVHITEARKILIMFTDGKNYSSIVGASGAVYGILLAFGLLFPEQVLLLFFVLPIKAKYMVLLYGIIEFLFMQQFIPGDNVAHLAHLAGMGVGCIILLWWKKKGLV